MRSRDDWIFTALHARLTASQRFALYDGRAWLDTELADTLAASRPITCPLVVLLCSGERNDAMSAAVLAGHPGIVVVRIDVDKRESSGADSIHVDHVQHLQLDQRRLGFDRLLSAMQYLVEHHGIRDAERLARFLVLDDPSSSDADAVRFLRMPSRKDARDRDGKLPPQAIRWLNELLRDYFARYPLTEDNGLSLSRARATALIDALDRPVPERGSELRGAEQELLQHLSQESAARDALVLLRQRLALGEDAVLALIICLAPDVDLSYQLIFGHIQDDMTRRFASSALIDALLFGHGSDTAANAVAQLRDWRLLAIDGQHAAAEQSLRIDPVIVQWLFVGDTALRDDHAVKSATIADAWTGGEFLCGSADRELRDEMCARLVDAGLARSWVVLSGSDCDGWRALLELAAADTRIGLLRVSLARFVALDMPAREDAAIRLARAARLMDWRMVVDCADEVIDAAALSSLVDACAEQPALCLLVSPDARVAMSSLPRGRWRAHSRGPSSLLSRTMHFRIVLSILGIKLELPTFAKHLSERLATAYPLSVCGLHAATALAGAAMTPALSADERVRALTSACRSVAAPDILRLARRIEPTYKLTEVLVPADRAVLLEEIVANTRHTRVVLDEWGFGNQLQYGRGVAALFAGPSGTGKTMAAQAIACELGVDVLAIDLSRIVSKYIGETEKHLDSVIGDAERSGAVLLFDEADALFGKRSEVKDAHDRYANIEVAYLLQRMEAFSGLAILTTNNRHNLDQAFLRRLRFIVDFPRPDASLRERIWRQCIPESAPVAKKVDWHMLAHFDLSGGVIRQVTLRAAFLAARQEKTEIGMEQLIEALRSEFNKLGMQAAEREVAEYQQALSRQDKAA
ncbi:MAG TPA: ATP-binding protein [Povalibacter sp.]|uniref:ATP-binding protein n=1 Tax=Povalibacter sp. TaxID=1962978 RepID=UPI002C4E51AF|nr:ATP-binding protein [Povalibacter sp.]HMN44671.1 ATP-binding protein [Povalibacter sp.]